LLSRIAVLSIYIENFVPPLGGRMELTMSTNLVEYFTNPVKVKLITEVEKQKKTTAKQLAKAVPQIPQATLYRYLKKMVSDGIIEVVEENQVRNVKEKVYSLVFDFDAEIKEMVNDKSGKGYLTLFQQFSNGLIYEFQKYVDDGEIDIANDGSGFRITPFYATKAELEEMAKKINEVVLPYHELAPSPERKLRNFAVVYTPPVSQ